MHLDKGSRSAWTDVLTDSETIYKAYVQLLNSLNQKVSHWDLCVLLSVLYARRGELLLTYIYLNSLKRKVIHSESGVLFSILYAKEPR